MAIGGFKSAIEVWDLRRGKRLSAFASSLDFGGTRLCLDASGERCFAGSYQAGVVEAYDATSGRTVWSRSRLPHPQYLSSSASGDRVYVGVERGPARALDGATGRIVETLAGVRRVFEGHGGVRFLDRARPVIERPGRTSLKVDRESSAILDVAIGPSSICLAEMGGPVRCLSLDSGAELWRCPLPKNEHVIAVSHCASIDAFVAVSFEYQESGNQTLIRIGPSGEATRLAALGGHVAELCLGGEALLLSDGRLLASATGKRLRVVPLRSPAPETDEGEHILAARRRLRLLRRRLTLLRKRRKRAQARGHVTPPPARGRIWLDGFAGPLPDELREAHHLVDGFFRDMEGVHVSRNVKRLIVQTPTWKRISALPRTAQVAVVRAAAERLYWNINHPTPGLDLEYMSKNTGQHFEGAAAPLVELLCKRRLPTTDADLVHLLSVVCRAHTDLIPTGRRSRRKRRIFSPGLGGTAVLILRLLRAHKGTGRLSRVLLAQVERLLRVLRLPDMENRAWIRHLTAGFAALLPKPNGRRSILAA